MNEVCVRERYEGNLHSTNVNSSNKHQQRPRSSENPKSDETEKKQPRCYKCKEVGHFINKCPNRNAKSSDPKAENKEKDLKRDSDNNKPGSRQTKKAMYVDASSPTLEVLLNCRQVDAVLDTGSSVTMVNKSALPDDAPLFPWQDKPLRSASRTFTSHRHTGPV